MGGPLSFKRHVVTELVPSEGLFVLTEAGDFAFRGPVFVRIAPLIDGRHSDDDIARALASELPVAQVYLALANLRRAGFISDAADDAPVREAAFWQAIGGASPGVSIVGRSAVRLLGFGDVELERFATRLRELGVGIDDDAAHTLVLTDDLLRVGLDAFDAEARARGQTYLVAKPLGLEPWIGPRVRGDQPGCLACLAQRLRGHRRVQRFLQDQTGRDEPYPTAIAALPSTIDMIAGLLATHVQLWTATPNEHALDRAVVSLDLRTLASTRHVLTPRPQCPRCGDPGMVARAQAQPIRIAPVLAPRRDGGQRSEDPSETYARLEHHISPITGIVSRMIRSTPPGSTAVHTYLTDHNFVHMTHNLEFLRVSLRSFSGGKGRSDIQARTSALCESIERYSGVRQGDEATRAASYTQLREAGERVVHPNDMMLYSDAQLRERERWNLDGELYCWVPERFDEHAVIDWTPAWSLHDDHPRWLATGLCFYAADSAWMRADSNGAAAGASIEEAILQGFMELVERDAIALWWYNRARVPGVDLASFEQPAFAQAQADLASRGRALWVLELPSDLGGERGVPCHVAVSRRVDRVGSGAGEELVFGFGAHFDAGVSIARAITELYQFLPFVGPDKHPPTSVPGRWYRHARIETEPYLWPDERVSPRRREDYVAFEPEDLRSELLRCSELVRARGLELLVQDHTRPDTGLSVVKVFVPGLRHFWARFGPGRLYDVPVALGLREQPCDEAELNPTPLFV